MRLTRPSHNPKAPHVRRQIHEVEPTMEAFVDRLRRLGAADDVVAEVVAHWNDPDWDADERAMVMGLSDESLRAELAGIEREYREHTSTPEEDAERLAVEREAAEILPEPVGVVCSWMQRENIVARAIAVEALESKRPRPRKTIMDLAAAIIDAADVPEV